MKKKLIELGVVVLFILMLTSCNTIPQADFGRGDATATHSLLSTP